MNFDQRNCKDGWKHLLDTPRRSAVVAVKRGLAAATTPPVVRKESLKIMSIGTLIRISTIAPRRKTNDASTVCLCSRIRWEKERNAEERERESDESICLS
jgi:hypothetical protein